VFNSGLKYDEDNKSFSVELRGLDVSKPGMFVRVTKAKQVSTSASVGLDDIIRTQKSLTAAY